MSGFSVTRRLLLLLIFYQPYAVYCESEDIVHIAIGPEHLVKYKDKVYVRFYQTIFDSLNDAGISSTDFLSRYKENGHLIGYKDVWQLGNGDVIISPGLKYDKNKNKYYVKSDVNWFGIGDPRNQLKFMLTYTNQGANQPLIRSFLVDYEAVQKVLQRQFLTDEKHNHNRYLSVNVDKYLPNQFKFLENDMKEITKNILVGSLNTYSYDPDNVHGDHNGNVFHLKEIFNDLQPGMEKDIPGIYTFPDKKDKFDEQLKAILDLYKPEPELYNNIKNKVNELNKNYHQYLNSENLKPLRSGNPNVLDIMHMKEKVLNKHINMEHDLNNILDLYKKAVVPRKTELNEKINELNRDSSGVLKVFNLDHLNSELEDIGSLYMKTTKTTRSQWLDFFQEDLTELKSLYNRLNEIPNDNIEAKQNIRIQISEKTNEYNEKYTRRGGKDKLYENDFPQVDKWIPEIKERKLINDRLYNPEAIADGGYFEVLKTNELPMQQISSIEEDHMFSKTNRDPNSMIDLVELSNRRRLQLESIDKFFVLCDAYKIQLESIINADKKKYGRITPYSKDLTMLMKAANEADDLFVAKLKCGFIPESTFSPTAKMHQITRKLADKLSTEYKNSFLTEMNGFLDQLLLKRQRLKYKTEVILQYGDTKNVRKNTPEFNRLKAVEDASQYLRQKFEKEGKSVVHLVYKGDHFESKKGSRLDVKLLENTRINIVGQGSTGPELKVGNRKVNEIADDLMKHVTVKELGEQVKLGKISIISCTDSSLNQLAPIDFGNELVKKLTDNNIESVVSVRNGQIMITENGMKLYGDNKEFQFRKEPPILIQRNDNQYKFGVYDMHEKIFKWSKDLPVMDGNGKYVMISENFGSYPLEYDVKTDKLQSLTDFDGVTSGHLQIDNRDISKTNLLVDKIDNDFDNKFVPDEQGVKSSLTELMAEDTYKRLSVANQEIFNMIPENDRSKNWIPLIDTASKEDGGLTKITVMDIESTETRIIVMKNDAFHRYKMNSKRVAMRLENLPSFSKTSIGMAGTGSLLGFGGFVYGAIQLSRAKKCEQNITCPTTENGKKLATALEINAYVSIAEGSLGVVFDSVQIAELAVGFKLSKSATNGIATMSKATANFLKVSKILGNVASGVGAVGGGVSLGFSIYQLAHAETKTQKIEFGLQVGFDALNLVVTAVAIGAQIAAVVTSSALASSIAAAAGPVGFVVAIIGILTTTITSLVFEFKATRNSAGQVGEYFWELHEVYHVKNGFEIKDDALRILEYAIVKKIDFKNKRINLDSQYIYRTRHGSSGSGKSNYFFWRHHFPKMVKSKYEAINVREGITYSRDSGERYFNSRNVKQLILPVIPKSYISYEYSRLPFCTAMHDKGFDIIRRLENDYRFDYDFYIVPGEEIISNIMHEYVDTEVTVILTDQIRVIASQTVPEKLSTLKHKYKFILNTDSTSHVVYISNGFIFELQNNKYTSCSWYLYSSDVNFNHISFSSGGTVQIDDSKIILRKAIDKIIITDHIGGTVLVDAHKQTKTLTSIHQGTNVNSEELLQYLVSNKNMLTGQAYIVVSNFTHAGKYIGKAYYEVAKERFLFSNYMDSPVSNYFKDSVQMLGKFGNNVYFMSEQNEEKFIWRTDAKTKTILSNYVLYCGNVGYSVMKMSTQEHSVILSQNIFNVSLVYMIYEDSLRLVFIDGDYDNIYKLSDACFPTLNEFLPNVLMHSSNQFPGKCVYAQSIPVLPLKRNIPSENITNITKIQHYWLYMNESYGPDHQANGIFCQPSKPPVATGIIVPNITNECDDLTLRDIQKLINGEEAFFFFCESDKQFFYQVGVNAAYEVVVPGGIDRIEDFGNIKLIKSFNGGMYKFTNDGNFSLMGLSVEYILDYKLNWTEAFSNLIDKSPIETFVPIFHLQLKINEDKGVTAWYDYQNERLIVVSPTIHTEDIIYLGPTLSPYLVWLYSVQTNQVFLQVVLEKEKILHYLDEINGAVYWNNPNEPYAKVVIDNVNSAEYMDGGVFIVNNNGVMIFIDEYTSAKLLGVNITWVSNRNTNYDEEIRRLCENFDTKELVTIASEIPDQKRWFHCGMLRDIILPAKHNPTYLGVNDVQGSIYFVMSGMIHEVKKYELKTQSKHEINGTNHANNISSSHGICKTSMAQKRGDTLLMQLPDYGIINNIPLISKTNTLVIGMMYNSEIVINPEIWLHYESIIITSLGSSGPQIGYVTLNPPFHCSYEYYEEDNNTLITDPISQRVIIFEDFTQQLGKVSSEYFPEGNEAVISISMCGQDPVTLVSNNEREDRPLALQQTSQEPDDSSCKTLVCVVLYIAGCLSVMGIVYLSLFYCVAKLRRKTRAQKCYMDLSSGEIGSSSV